MHPVRRVLSLIAAIAMLGAGAYSLVFFLFFAANFKMIWFASAVASAVMGALWLYADFIDATPNEDLD